MKDIFVQTYLNIINEGAYSQKYLDSIAREEQDRYNEVHHFVKKIDKNPQMLKDPEVISRIANCWWYLPADKAEEWKPIVDEFYKSIKRS